MAEAFPQYVLCDTLWDFAAQGPYRSREVFDAAVHSHHLEAEVSPEECWQPAALAMPSCRAVIRYFSDPPGEGELCHEVELSCDGVAGFTAGELLYKLHNAVIERVRGNWRHWFEGLCNPGYRLRENSVAISREYLAKKASILNSKIQMRGQRIAPFACGV